MLMFIHSKETRLRLRTDADVLWFVLQEALMVLIGSQDIYALIRANGRAASHGVRSLFHPLSFRPLADTSSPARDLDHGWIL